MNRLVFSEGGQPVCLDDLKLLQDNEQNDIKTIFLALSDSKAFLLSKMNVENLEVVNGSKTGFTLKSGSIVIDGEFFSWQDTRLVIDDWNQPIYLCVRESESDNRTFEDGQDRMCILQKSVYASISNEGASSYYNIYDLPMFTDLLKTKLNVAVDNNWKNMDVTFSNGYSGTVQYQELQYYYKVRINVKSSSRSWTSSSDQTVFIFDSEKYPNAITECASTSFMTGGDTMYRVKEAHLLIYGERCILSSETIDFSMDTYSPGDCYINVIFDVPK